MSSKKVQNRTALFHSLSGLGTYFALAAATTAVHMLYRSPVTAQALWVVLAGFPAWLHALFMYAFSFAPSLRSPESEAKDSDGFRRYRRFVLPALEIVTIALLLQAVRIWLMALRADAPIVFDQEPTMPVIGIALAGTFVDILATAFFLRLCSLSGLVILRTSAFFFIIDAFGKTIVWVVLIAAYMQAPFSAAAGLWAFGLLAALFAIEMGFHTISRYFKPHTSMTKYQSAFAFSSMEMLLHPTDAKSVLFSLLHDVFGFDISQTSFFRFASRALVPFIAASAFFLEAASCVFFVEPHQQAIVLAIGKIQPRVYTEGIHFKLPWPLGKHVLFDSNRIRTMHVGSHKPSVNNQSVFLEGVPLLWTNIHGKATEELLILSAPKGLLEGARESGANIGDMHNQAPSVSLAGADIVVHYAIADLLEYCTFAENTQEILQCKAEQLMSQLLYRFDIDSFMSNARLNLAAAFEQQLQHICDRHAMGVTIVSAGITAIHPPLPTAKDFEETVIAAQEKETTIQEARQASVQMKIEATGSQELFDSIAASIETAESKRAGLSTSIVDLLLKECGGEVSQVLSEALAYRWTREHVEGGNADRFFEKYKGYRNAPRAYRNDQICTIIEDSLSDRKKIVVAGKPRDILLQSGEGAPAASRALKPILE